MTDREFVYKMVFAGTDSKIERTGELIRCRNCQYHRHRAGMCDVYHVHKSGDGYCDRGSRYGKHE